MAENKPQPARIPWATPVDNRRFEGILLDPFRVWVHRFFSVLSISPLLPTKIAVSVTVIAIKTSCHLRYLLTEVDFHTISTIIIPNIRNCQ